MFGANAQSKFDYPPEPEREEEEEEAMFLLPAKLGDIDWNAITDAIRAEMPTTAHAEAIDEQLLLDCIVIELTEQGILDRSATKGWAS